MKNWWRTDEELMKDWWRTDDELMKNWRRTDEELMKNWWKITDSTNYKSTASGANNVLKTFLFVYNGIIS